ncbi:MAG: class I SAM-dependent methyltransferase [Streptosporangiaceae bacterium]
MDDRADPYASGLCRWWHLTEPSPDLLAAETAGTLGGPGVVVDLGCGLGSEVGYLAGKGWHGLGIDVSATALTRARSRHGAPTFACADVTRLPLLPASVDLLIDRGCFHYLDAAGRAAYAREASRVLRAGGRLLLRMCLTSAGEPNGLGEHTIRETFEAWHLAGLRHSPLRSDTRTMPAVIALLIRSARRDDRPDIRTSMIKRDRIELATAPVRRYEESGHPECPINRPVDG